MNEKRHSLRMSVSMNLDISSLFKQDNVRVGDVHATIHVTDVSKSGIGFKSKSILPIGYYFNANIMLGDTEANIYTVVKIIRQEKISEDEMSYGCEFVGMAPVLDYIFDEYEEKQKLV